jgi:hypothetical protein
MLSNALGAALCALVFWRGLQGRLPFFTVYVVLQFLTGLAGWVVSREFGFWSSTLYYVAWAISGTLLVAEWLVTAELCYRGFQAYRGIWAMTWRLLLGLFAILLMHAGYGAVRQPNHRIGSLILMLHRDLALASAAILIAMLVVAQYYQLEFGPLERRIAIGLCAYFITVVLSNSLLVQWYLTHWPAFSGHPPSQASLEAWWNGVQLVVFDAALVAWCLALRKPLPAPKPEPTLLPPETYGELSPAINYRLRALNARLMDILKA